MLVGFTDYALSRMSERDVLVEEVVQALERAPLHHRPGKVEGREEVTLRTGQRVLLVVYRRRGEGYLVINAMWE